MKINYKAGGMEQIKCSSHEIKKFEDVSSFEVK
jgi:hypothetical protein